MEKAGRPWRYLWKILDQRHRQLDVGEAEEKLQPRGGPDRGHDQDDECEEPGEHEEADGQPGHPLVASLRMRRGRGRGGWGAESPAPDRKSTRLNSSH